MNFRLIGPLGFPVPIDYFYHMVAISPKICNILIKAKYRPAEILFSVILPAPHAHGQQLGLRP